MKIEELNKIYKDHISTGMSIAQLSKKYGFHRSTIERGFKKNNLNLVSKIDFYKKNKKEMLKLYNENNSLNDISKTLNIPLTHVWRILKDDIDISRRSVFHYREKIRKYDIDESIFKNIDTPNKAYFLGFLFADGNAHSVNYNIKLKLQERDKHILNDIKEAFNLSQNLLFSKAPNDRSQNQYSLIISNKIIYNDLVNHGVRPNKTWRLFFPWALDKKLYSHFVRGYFDGDGCIYYDKKRGNATISICGTREMCDDLKIIFKENLGIDSQISPDKNIFRIRLRRYRDIRRFYDWIYADADLKLMRKLEKFKEIEVEKCR